MNDLHHANYNAVLRQPGVSTACTPVKAPAQSQSWVHAEMWALPHAQGIAKLAKHAYLQRDSFQSQELFHKVLVDKDFAQD